MEQLKIKDLEKLIEKLKKNYPLDYQEIPVYIGNDDELNGIHTGWSGGQDTYETIEVYESIVAKQLLPTQSGFFFGSTEYTEYYKEDLEDTIRQLEQVLKETDFGNEELYYYASY